MSSLGATTTADGPSSTTEQAKEKAQEGAQQAKRSVRDQVDQRSTDAGHRVSSTAQDIRSVSEELRNQGKDQPAKLAEQAADRAERLGGYLKNSDGDTILRDVEDFGRRQPWAGMFGGLTAGFLASRFLKASHPRPYETGAQMRAARTGYGQPPPARRRGRVPPVTPVPPVQPAGGVTDTGAPVRREPGVGEPTPGRPAENVSLTGGVMPPESPG